MLFDPEKKTRIDNDTRVFTSDSSEARRQCEEIAENLQKKGHVVRNIGVKKNRRGTLHNCIQEWEVDDDK